MKNKLYYNSLTGTLLYVLNIIIMFIMSPVIIKSLGNRDYGLWEMVMALIGYMGLFDLGIGPALLRNVAVAYAKDDRDELQEIISSAQMFFIVIGLAAALCLLVLSRYPSLIAGRESDHVGYLGTVLILFAINVGMSFPLNVFTAVLMGVQRHYLINITRGGLGIIRSIIAYTLLVRYSGLGLLILATLELAFNLLQFTIFIVAIRSDSSIPGVSLSACSLRKLKELFAYGSKSAILLVASRIQSASIPFVISTVVGVSSIVYFTIPNRIVDYGKGLSLAIGFPLTPYFASIIADDDKNALKISWLQTSFALQIITLAMPFFIIFCGESFLTIWIGKEYSSAGRGVLYCLSVALVAESIAPNASRILMATGHHGRAALLWLVLSIASVPLAMFGASKWGITGVALGSATAMIIGSVATLHMACHDVGVTIVSYFRSTLFRLVLPLVLLAFMLWMTGRVLSTVNYLNLTLQVSLCTFIYLVAVWFISLTCDNRLQISSQISAKIKLRTLLKKALNV